MPILIDVAVTPRNDAVSAAGPTEVDEVAAGAAAVLLPDGGRLQAGDVEGAVVGPSDRRTEALHVAREIAAERRICQQLFFGRIEARDTEKCQIGFTNEWRLAPEAHELGGAASGEMRNDHAIHAPGGGGGRSIEVGVAIHVNHAHFAEITARAGDGG